ncbi:MAG TPA: tripartite tricarboxylate transporter substrate binding protein [Eoetvoesiella sp.]
MKKNSFIIRSLCIAALCINPVMAQTYPTKPINIVVPFAAGGGADIPARIIAKKLSESLGQAVVVENRPGATGTIGSNYVAKAKPDGYTLLVSTPSSHTMAPHTIKQLPYDPLGDLKPITLFASVRHLLVVNPEVPANTVKELIDLAKAKPGALNYSSSGNGSSVHLATEMFNRMADISMKQIPYGGVTPAAVAVVGGQVDLNVIPAALALPHIQTGALRPLVVLTPNRFSALPNVPTIAEVGLNDYKAEMWLGLLAPANTPDHIVQTLQAEIARIVGMEDVKETLGAMSIDVIATSTKEFDERIKTEYSEYGALIKELGLNQ